VPRVATLQSTTNRGASWSAVSLPREIDALHDISCASSIRCLAVGYIETNNVIDGVLLATSNGGTTWSEVSLPATIDQITSIDCPSGTLCLMIAKDAVTAFGDSPTRILRSTDAGATWTTVSTPSDAPQEIQCPTTSACVAFTSSARHVSTDGGISWSVGALPGLGSMINGHIECPAADRCIATGLSFATPRVGTVAVAVSSDLFATWTVREVATGGTGTAGRAVDVSCSSATACYVTGWYEGAVGGFVTKLSIA
jgi:hypothetical protein